MHIHTGKEDSRYAGRIDNVIVSDQECLERLSPVRGSVQRDKRCVRALRVILRRI